MIENIIHANRTLAVLLHAGYREEGIRFFTPDDFSQQLGYMNRPQGYVIPPHVHNPVAREVLYTQEVLFLKKGRLRVDAYDSDQRYLKSRILEAGDVILLATGGHGFEVLEEIERVEVKQASVGFRIVVGGCSALMDPIARAGQRRVAMSATVATRRAATL
jgi:hypothetical protein